jgi:hypothetical protein
VRLTGPDAGWNVTVPTPTARDAGVDADDGGGFVEEHRRGRDLRREAFGVSGRSGRSSRKRIGSDANERAGDAGPESTPHDPADDRGVAVPARDSASRRASSAPDPESEMVLDSTAANCSASMAALAATVFGNVARAKDVAG